VRCALDSLDSFAFKFLFFGEENMASIESSVQSQIPQVSLPPPPEEGEDIAQADTPAEPVQGAKSVTPESETNGPMCPADFSTKSISDLAAELHPVDSLSQWKSPTNEVSIVAGNVPAPQNVVSTGYPTTTNIDLGNPKPQSPLGWLTGGMIELSQPENNLARYVAKNDYGLSMNSDNRTMTLPNTEQGGRVFANIQNTQVGYLGNNLDHGKPLTVPADASPEFKKGYEAQSQKNGWENLIHAGTTIGHTLVAGVGGKYNMNVRTGGSTLETPITRPVGASKAGNLREKLTWKSRGDTPAAWNQRSNPNGSGSDCNWCTLENITGYTREQLATHVKANGVQPGEMMSYREMGDALFQLRLIDKVPSQVVIKGARNEVIEKMLQQPVGKNFSLSFSDSGVDVPGSTGHNVLAVRTANGIEIRDGQVNQTYNINQYPAKTLYAYPLERTYNPSLHQ
jgi:hypothetical protein